MGGGGRSEAPKKFLCLTLASAFWHPPAEAKKRRPTRDWSSDMPMDTLVGSHKVPSDQGLVVV